MNGAKRSACKVGLCDRVTREVGRCGRALEVATFGAGSIGAVPLSRNGREFETPAIR